MECLADPIENLGKPYQRGMLPFGGAVNSHGIITQVVSEADYHHDMNILKNLISSQYNTTKQVIGNPGCK